VTLQVVAHLKAHVMKKAESPARWYHPWQSQRVKDDDDAADMGTAFGLDMSISDEAADAAAAARTATATRELGFMARWNNRRKNAN